MIARESMLSHDDMVQTATVDSYAALQRVGHGIIRYGLVLVLAWIGAMKFTAYEAHGIQPLVANSPLMGWLYGVFSVHAQGTGRWRDAQ
jgi:uncharacterized membrane protein YkgB